MVVSDFSQEHHPGSNSAETIHRASPSRSPTSSNGEDWYSPINSNPLSSPSGGATGRNRSKSVTFATPEMEFFTNPLVNGYNCSSRRGSNASNTSISEFESSSIGNSSPLNISSSSTKAASSLMAIPSDALFQLYLNENARFLKEIERIRISIECSLGISTPPIGKPLPGFDKYQFDLYNATSGGRRRSSAPTAHEMQRAIAQMKLNKYTQPNFGELEKNEASTAFLSELSKAIDMDEMAEMMPKASVSPKPRWEPEKLNKQSQLDRGEEFVMPQRFSENISPPDSPLSKYLAKNGLRRGSDAEQARGTFESNSISADISLDASFSTDLDNSKSKTDDDLDSLYVFANDYSKFGDDLLNDEFDEKSFDLSPPASPNTSSLNDSAPMFQFAANQASCYMPPPYPQGNSQFGQIFGLNYINYPNVLAAAALGFNLTTLPTPPIAPNGNPLGSRDDPLESKAKDHREAASRLAECRNIYSLTKVEFKPPTNAVYSTKVFLGGVPWEMSDQDMLDVFKSYGVESIQRPGKDVRLSRGSKSQDKAGYLYLIFNNSANVGSLIDACKMEFSHTGHKYFYTLTSKRSKEKRVQVIPWNTDNATYTDMHLTSPPKLDQRRTVFLGALHGMMTAKDIALALNIFGPVEHVSLDIDKCKYPTGSGKAVFKFPESYRKAIKDGFVKITCDRFVKTIQIDEYLDDAQCDSCTLEKGPVFCKGCNAYFCKTCWNRVHMGGQIDHQILMKSGRLSTSPTK